MPPVWTQSVRRMAYTCRGCGTQITTPSSFQKCPVCGIRIN